MDTTESSRVNACTKRSNLERSHLQYFITKIQGDRPGETKTVRDEGAVLLAY